MRKTLRNIAVASMMTFGLGASAQTALDFDGVNDHVLIPGVGAAMDGSTDWTVEFWVQDPDNNSYPFAINSSEYILIHPAGTIVYYSNGGNIQSQNSTWVLDGQPHHVAIRATGGVGQIFVDGAPVAMLTTAHTGLSGISAEDFSIGSDYAPTTQIIDDFRIWNVARTNTEIANNYDQCLDGTEPGLLVLYNFEDGTGSSIVTDLTGNGYDGGLINMDPANAWVAGWNGCTGDCSTPADQTVSAAQSSFVCEGGTTIDLGSSETGVNYYLMNASNDSILGGPESGTGSGLGLNTGAINSTTDFSVTAYTPGGSSDALHFDGVDDVVVGSNNPAVTLTGDITLETWLYVDVMPVDWVRIVGKGNDPNRTYGMWLNPNGSILWQMYGPTSLSLGTTAGLITSGSWYHLAMTRSGSDCKIFINGIEVANTTYTGTPYTDAAPLTIGSMVTLHDHLEGSIDEVRVWNVGRTVTDINNDMTNCLTGTEQGLVAYYPFEEGTGAATTLDLASSQHGTLTNMDPATDWVTGATTCGACLSTMTQTATVTINPLTDQTVTAATATICPNTGTTIDLGSTENDVNYYLRDDSDDSVVDGPFVGNGSGASLNTGNISTTTTYNVYAEKHRSALSLDGVDEYVRVPDDPALVPSTQLTIEIWAKSNTPVWNDFGFLFNKRDSYIIHPDGASSNITFAITTTTGSFTYQAPVTDITQWHHYSMAWDGSTLYGYIDGVQVGSVATTGTLLPSSQDILLGYDIPFSRFFDGMIDDARMWDTYRTPAEIAANYDQCLTGSEPGLVMYLPMNDLGGTTVKDVTGNGHDGTAFNIESPTDWVPGSPACTACSLEMSTLVTVTVQDNAPTVASAPSNMNTVVDAGTCGAVVNYTDPTFDDDCDGTGLSGTMTSGLASGSTFPVGTTTVEFTYTDGSSQTVTASFDVVVTDNENPTITAPGNVNVNANDVNCSASGIALGSPTTSDNCSVASVTNDAPATFPNGTTTITWTVTDGSGNTATATQDVIVSSDLAGSATELPVDCNGNTTGGVDLTVTGGTSAFTYQWDDAGSSTTEDLSGVPAGTYNVVIIDANGCTANASATVTEPTALSVTVDASSDPTGCGLSDGTASITATGGTVAGAYSYSWTDGGSFNDTNEDQTALAAGAYTVTVTDDNGCTAIANVTLSDPNGPTVSTDSTNSVLVLACNGDANGEIQIDVVLNGGATSATYDWDNDGTGDNDDTEDLTGLGAGTYNLTMEDDNGCTASLSLNINEPTALSGSATSTDELMGNDGTIDLTVTGGTSPYTYSWTGPNGFTSTIEDPTGLEAGTYDVTVTDANGCTTTVQVVVSSQVGISENALNSIKLYPNPSTGAFFVESNMTQGTIVIMDAAGCEVARKAVNGTRTELDLTGKENGVYFVQLRMEEGTRTLRILLNK